MKDEITRVAQSQAAHQMKRLVADEPNRIETYTIEMDIAEKLQRIYYFAKKIAKTVVDENPPAKLPEGDGDLRVSTMEFTIDEECREQSQSQAQDCRDGVAWYCLDNRSQYRVRTVFIARIRLAEQVCRYVKDAFPNDGRI